MFTKLCILEQFAASLDTIIEVGDLDELLMQFTESFPGKAGCSGARQERENYGERRDTR